MMIIACFCFPFSVSAKGFKITTEQLNRLQTILSLVKTFMNTGLNDEAITKAMNLTFRVEGMAADIGYGLVVMSAINELDLIDMIVSQRYKQQATAFFEKVVDDKTNLVSYWKGVGFDLPRILKQSVTSPMAALSLESFEITEKTIAIFSTFEVIRQGKIYDGIWYYFDSRRNNDSHDTAWSNAVDLMGFAANTGIVKNEVFLIGKKSSIDKIKQLESEFISLWDKWGKYTDSNGVTEEAKQIFSVEAAEMVAEAVRKQQIAESQQIPLADRLKSSLTKFAESVQSLGEGVKNAGANLISTTKNAVNGAISSLKNFLSSRYQWFPAAIVDPEPDNSPPSKTTIIIDDSASKDIEDKARTLEEAINDRDNSDQLGVVTQRINEFNEALKNAEAEASSGQPETTAINNIPEENNASSEPVICSFDNQSVSASSVIINEVAWMGSIASGDNEWIELKNVSSREINLNGWQLIDKSRQIKIIFGREGLPSAGLYLLERSNDDAVFEIKADKIYTGRLNDTEEELYLFDSQCQIRDKAVANPNWPGGDKKTKQTMERRSNRDWQTSNASNGTPKKENSYGSIYYNGALSGGSSSKSSSGQSGGETFVDTSLPLILISEAASGIDNSGNEYITLYNPTDKDVVLNDDNFSLKLANSADKATAKKIVWSRKKISANGYFLLTAGSISGIAPDAAFSAQLSGVSGIIISDGNGNIKDRVAWGECLPQSCGSDEKQPPQSAAESGGKVLIGGLKTNQSLKRLSGINGKPADTNNNENDFILNSEPTLINSQGDTVKISLSSGQGDSDNPPNDGQSLKDTIAPVVSFLPISAVQYLPSFTISWSGEDSGGAATPSGIDGFVLRYSEDKTNWTYQPSETSFDPAPDYNFSGAYGHQYFFELKGRDKSGNMSEWLPVGGLAVSVEVAPTGLVINEIAWMGTAASTSGEWIELFNISDKEINLSDWSIYGADTAKCLNLINGKDYITNKIKPNEYLVYANDRDTVKDETNQSIVDIWDATISLNNTSPGQLILYSRRDCQGTAIDTVNQTEDSWFNGNNDNKTTMERVNPQSDGASADSWKDNDMMTKNGIDAEGNPLNGTPKAKNSVYANLPPKAITDLAINTGNSSEGKVSLSWSAPDDNNNPLDTLSYDIRYLAGEEITENNWAKALPINNEPAVQANGQGQQFAIEYLNYDKTYYFGIKTANGKDDSPLSNIVSYQTGGRKQFIWPMAQGNKERTGLAITGGLTIPAVKWSLNKQISVLAIGNGGIIYAGGKDGLYRVNPSDGSVYWTYSDIKDITGIAIGDDGMIYAVSGTGLTAIDQLGNKVWEFPLAVHYRNLQPVFSEEKLYLLAGCVAGDDRLPNYSLIKLKESGTTDWVYDLDNQQLHNKSLSTCGNKISVSEGERISSLAMDGDGNLYFGIDNKLYSLFGSGNLRWTTEIGTGKIKSPVVVGNRVYCTGDYLAAIDADTGGMSWPEMDSKGISNFSLGADSNAVYLLTRIGDWRAFLAINSDGTKRWQKDNIDFVSGLAPVIDANGLVYVVTETFNYSVLKGYDPTGMQLVEYPFSGPPANGAKFIIIGDNGDLYITGNKLYAIGALSE